MKQFVCIHGHFYQPPRENPWLEAIELQDSAYPFHDWNARITDECYRQNAQSRILDDEGYIAQIVNNYARISFNFGPTVLSWMQEHAFDVYSAIIEANEQSAERFSGHGSAMAQAYNHMILPLANERDRKTQIKWGIRDFEHRFGRRPEGMWLPETAVDTPSLEDLAEEGIRFTVLAPHQAEALRSKRGGRASELNGNVDPSRAYEVRLPSGNTINVFFYDGPISQAVAFEGLLNSGGTFMERLLTGFSDDRNWTQLSHIATDGETYGHHHRFGDMALAFALDRIDSTEGIDLTNYAEFLDRFPPDNIVEIVENSSWSCMHGIERWRSDCGCSTGGHAGWNQQWRQPLRESLDWLRDAVAPKYEQQAGQLLTDPWLARDEYIEVLLDRSEKNVNAFLERHAKKALSGEQQTRVLSLLEMQRHAMLMYTSCGWFFDELSRIETVQVIQYAGRTIQLAERLFNDEFEEPFLQRLERAMSNVAEHGNGRQIFEKFVRPTFVDLDKVGAHYAISSLFEDYEEETSVYCYTVEAHDTQRFSTGKAHLNIGRAQLTSRITREQEQLIFAAIHLGEHIMNGAVRPDGDVETFTALVDEASELFNRADFTGLLRMLDTHFGSTPYALDSLFRDEQRRVMDLVLDSSLRDVEAIYRNIYHDYAPMIRFLTEHDLPVPAALRMPAEFVLNARFRRTLQTDPPDVDEMRSLLEEVSTASVTLDEVTLSYSADHALQHAAEQLQNDPRNISLIERTLEIVDCIGRLPFGVDRAKLQNAVYNLAVHTRPEVADSAQRGNEISRRWLEVFDQLTDELGLRIAT